MTLAIVNAAMMLGSATALAGMEVVEKLDAAKVNSWDDVTFKAFLILCLGVSVFINITRERSMWRELYPRIAQLGAAIDRLTAAAGRLDKATQRCLQQQGVVVGDE